MSKWIVVVDCDDEDMAAATAAWLKEEFDWPAWVEERN